MNVRTNIGKEFLNLLDKAFPPDNPLSKLFNRQTVKISYKRMPNMAQAVAGHNSKRRKEVLSLSLVVIAWEDLPPALCRVTA